MRPDAPLGSHAEPHRSQVAYKTLDPVWNADFIYKATKDELLAMSFAFRAFDYDGQGATCDKLGSTELSLSELGEVAESHEFTLDMSDSKIKGSQGDLVVSLRCASAEIEHRSLACIDASSAPRR